MNKNKPKKRNISRSIYVLRFPSEEIPAQGQHNTKTRP